MDINKIFAELAQYTRMEDDLETIVESLRDQIKQYMTENNVDTVIGAEHVATWKECSRETFNKKEFEKVYPGVYNEFTSATTYKRFNFK